VIVEELAGVAGQVVLGERDILDRFGEDVV